MRLLPTLHGLNNLLRCVTHRIRASAASVLHANPCLTLWGGQPNVSLQVAEVVHVLATGAPESVLDVRADVQALVGGPPAFVVVAAHEVRGNALFLWPILNEVLNLPIQRAASRSKVKAIKATDSVDNVSSLENIGNSLRIVAVEKYVQ